MTTCIIIEDQGPAKEILVHYISKLKHLKLLGSFTDVLEAASFMKFNPVDLLFLDINLPKMSGMDFLRNETVLPKTILTTAYSEFALECYEYNVVDYLLKPFSFERFVKAINKLEERDSVNGPIREESPKSGLNFVKAGTGLVQVDMSKVLYIRSDGDYTEVITPGDKHLTSHSLKEWTEKLGTGFVQVHRSYIVHIHFIQKVLNNKIHIGNVIVPVGRSYKKKLMERLK